MYRELVILVSYQVDTEPLEQDRGEVGVLPLGPALLVHLGNDLVAGQTILDKRKSLGHHLLQKDHLRKKGNYRLARKNDTLSRIFVTSACLSSMVRHTASVLASLLRSSRPSIFQEIILSFSGARVEALTSTPDFLACLQY